MYLSNTLSIVTASFFGFFQAAFGEIQNQELLLENFKRSMDGVCFTGFFTVDGTESPPTQGTYEVQNVKKFVEGDLWIFTARIKYGKNMAPYRCLSL